MNPFRNKYKKQFPQSPSRSRLEQPRRQFPKQYADQPPAFLTPQQYGSHRPKTSPSRYSKYPGHVQQPTDVEQFQPPIAAEFEREDSETTFEPNPFPGAPEVPIAADLSEEEQFTEPEVPSIGQTDSSNTDSSNTDSSNTDSSNNEELPSLTESGPEFLELETSDKGTDEEETTPPDDESLPSLTGEEFSIDKESPLVDELKPEKPSVDFDLPSLAGTEPTDTEPTSTEPTATEPTATEPTATEPTATESTATESTVAESTSPFSGKTLAENEEKTESEKKEKLPNLQPVPNRNDYINLDKLNRATSRVDREAMRREKRRLLLLSRPDRKGLKGFCPVVLKTDRDLVDVKAEFESEYQLKTYHFSSAEAKAAFDLAPDQYAPVKGGADVVKSSRGEGEIEGTLEFAAWFRGRLYLFSSASSYDSFMALPSTYAVKRN